MTKWDELSKTFKRWLEIKSPSDSYRGLSTPDFVLPPMPKCAPAKQKCMFCKTKIQKVIIFAENHDGLPNINNPPYCPNCGRKL